ncbi:MAG TPA: cation:proton antiporter [Polyangia bacterium]|jgi:Kef-type K+ transport system membrane component KefB|nr:cation:proton antiporter [Polyangia bacterium]
MLEPLRPLAGHAVYLLLLQLALLIAVARVGAELAKRVGLPAVVGELAAGIALGPSGLGHYAPELFDRIFPRDASQFHLLDAFGSFGMALLLLLTGLETDVRLLKNLGRAALIASAMGMVLPFALGFGLGYLMPAQYLADPQSRILFAVFLATAMSISAMPVIAKILVDLDLTRRNIGLVILSAGVVDDTVGWLILSLIAGAASRGAVHVGELGVTMLGLAAFLVASALVLYPLLRLLVRITTSRFRTPDSDLVLMIVVTLLCAAATERIGVHAVFGAFVAGVVLHQVPRIRRETIARLESFVFGVLAPIFFGIVGLKVNLWALGGGGMLALVIGVACLGKLVGCTLGAIWGGLRFWEAASIAVAMNARGAMEIVVAMIGLSLGILSVQMFSIIVMVAIVTSFMAPIGLRLTMARVRITEDEAQRILASSSKGAFDPHTLRVLLATAGGPSAGAAAPLAFGVAARSDSPITVVYAEVKVGWWRRWVPRMRQGTPSNVSQHLEALRAHANGHTPEIRRLAASTVARAICEEAARGYDLILIGSGDGPSVGGPVVEEVVAQAPCHVAIMKAAKEGGAAGFRNILVPVDGSVASRTAVELALRYAESAGAALVLAVLTERRPQAAAYTDVSGTHATPEASSTSAEELERISVVFRASALKPTILHLVYDPRSSAVVQAVEKGGYDLVVLGAENRAIQHRLFFGYENERLIRATRAPVVVVVPHLGRLAR